MPLIVYKSSAGSGKTYTLVREYVRLLIQNPSAFRNILAITFTNKATAEMKSRIVSALTRLSAGNFKDYEAYLIKELYNDYRHTEADREKYILQIRANARKALQNILHNYSEFSVSTIDSFFQKILRSFTKELKLPMRYELEMDTEYALDEIVMQLMQEVGHDKELTKWLEDFTFARIEEDKGWDITQTITDLGKEIFKEEVWEFLTKNEANDVPPNDAQPGPANPDEEENQPDNGAASLKRRQRYKQLKHLILEIEKLKYSFETQMAAFGKQTLELIAGHGLQITDFKDGTASFFDKIADKNFSEPGKTLQSIAEGKTNNWRTQNSQKKEKIDQLVHNGGLQTLLIETLNYYNQHLPAYQSAAEVLKNVYVYAVLHDLKDKLLSYRTEKSLMLISDTNNVLREIISNENAPFVYEKVGTVYNHMLIDEFQDTSAYQWQNLLPLVFNSLGAANTVLIVGDVKQSIYRWRGGNLQLLLKQIKKDLREFYTEKTEKELTDNYRSAKNIINFNNAFFETVPQLLASEEGQKQLHRAYASVTQGIVRQEKGYVSVKLIADQKADGKTIGWKEQARIELVEKINNLKAQHCQLHNMAILVRTNAQGSEIAQFLNEHNIPVISSESLLLKSSVKVQLLIAALHYMANTKNSIAKTEILVNYLAIHRPEYKPDHLVFTDHLNKSENGNPMFTQILPPDFETNLQRFAQKPLYECVEMLLQQLQLNTQPDAYVQRFQDLILEFTRTKSADVGHFLEWWQENKDRDKTSVIVPEGENAVTVMTIHKAKGLEFPVVFIPYADWSMKPDIKTILWTQTDAEPFNQLGAIPLFWSLKLQNTVFEAKAKSENLKSFLDNLNLLYVAFTRPTQELYIFSKQVKKQNNPEIPESINQLLWNALNSFAHSQQFNPDEGTFEYGQPTNWALMEQKSTQTMQKLTTYLSNDYRSKITLRSDSERFFMLFDNAASEPIKLGQKIHAVLEKLIGPQDVDKVIRKLQIKGLLTAADEQPIKQRLAQIFALPQVQEWFSPQWEVLAERTLLCNNQQRIPDRVIIHHNRAIIIDYKTGKPDAKHHRQLHTYARWIEDMGYTINGKYLLYLYETGAEVVEVTGE